MSIEYPQIRSAEEAGFTAPEERGAYHDAVTLGLQAANLYISSEAAKEHITARTSEVTELPNKRALQERLTELQASGRINEYAYLLGDGRNFKAVNDMLDHAVGDTTLRETAFALIRSLRSIYSPSGEGRDEVFHLSGDEFVALLHKGPATSVDIDNTRRRVDQSMRQVLENDPRLQVLGYGLDIGIANPNENSTIESLAAEAETEMKEAKRKGHAKHGQHRSVGAVATGFAEQQPVSDTSTVKERRRALIASKYEAKSTPAPSSLDKCA